MLRVWGVPRLDTTGTNESRGVLADLIESKDKNGTCGIRVGW
jgi:hypothetical protein